MVQGDPHHTHAWQPIERYDDDQGDPRRPGDNGDSIPFLLRSRSHGGRLPDSEGIQNTNVQNTNVQNTNESKYQQTQSKYQLTHS